MQIFSVWDLYSNCFARFQKLYDYVLSIYSSFLQKCLLKDGLTWIWTFLSLVIVLQLLRTTRKLRFDFKFALLILHFALLNYLSLLNLIQMLIYRHFQSLQKYSLKLDFLTYCTCLSIYFCGPFCWESSRIVFNVCD